jgi:hypothetical protein
MFAPSKITSASLPKKFLHSPDIRLRAVGLNFTKEENRVMKRTYNRPGSRGHRNAENNPLDNNDGGEIDSSGNRTRKTKSTAKAARKFESRGQLERTGQKRPRSQSELRDSTREPARGRSEFTGQMNKRLTNRGNMVRTGKTSTKNKAAAETR